MKMLIYPIKVICYNKRNVNKKGRGISCRGLQNIG